MPSSRRPPLRGLAAAAAVALLVTGCGSDDASEASSGDRGSVTSPQGSPQVMAQDFEVPWGLVVLDDSQVLVGERDTARVWRVAPGQDPQPVTTVPGVEPGGEGGLLGIVVPPGGGGGSFYAYATTETDNRVLFVDTTATTEEGGPRVRVVLDGIPKAGNHNGGRLAFGPDDYLYVSTGDASDGASAQDLDSLGGKILRITTDGDPAPGNPDPDSPVWSMGHRNVQGLGWDEAGRMWASEFGQNDVDEVNLIEPGGNYGWPQFEGPGGEPEFIDPVVTWPTSQASPSGLAVGPEGDLYVAALRGESLWRVPVDDEGRTGGPERMLQGEYGRLRSVVTGPDDALWVLTNNTSRGTPRDGDDKLLRIEHQQLDARSMSGLVGRVVAWSSSGSTSTGSACGSTGASSSAT